SPLRDFGTENDVLYHKTLSGPTVFPTPDKVDSIANGTRILPSKVVGCAAPCGVTVYSHRPLRLSQFSRTKRGLGYSCKTFVGSNWSAHSVVILPGTIVQSVFCPNKNCAWNVSAKHNSITVFLIIFHLKVMFER